MTARAGRRRAEDFRVGVVVGKGPGATAPADGVAGDGRTSTPKEGTP